MTFCKWLIEYQGIATIITFLIIIIALIPILREWIQKNRYKRILREQMLIEIRDINQSYKGKNEIYKNEWDSRKDISIIVPEHDKDFFKRLAISFEKATYLSRKEKTNIGLLIRTFRKGSYRKDNKENIIDKNSIENIIKYSNDILKILKDKLD